MVTRNLRSADARQLLDDADLPAFGLHARPHDPLSRDRGVQKASS